MDLQLFQPLDGRVPASSGRYVAPVLEMIEVRVESGFAATEALVNAGSVDEGSALSPYSGVYGDPEYL